MSSGTTPSRRKDGSTHVPSGSMRLTARRSARMRAAARASSRRSVASPGATESAEWGSRVPRQPHEGGRRVELLGLDVQLRALELPMDQLESGLRRSTPAGSHGKEGPGRAPRSAAAARRREAAGPSSAAPPREARRRAPCSPHRGGARAFASRIDTEQEGEEHREYRKKHHNADGRLRAPPRGSATGNVARGALPISDRCGEKKTRSTLARAAPRSQSPPATRRRVPPTTHPRPGNRASQSLRDIGVASRVRCNDALQRWVITLSQRRCGATLDGRSECRQADEHRPTE